MDHGLAPDNCLPALIHQQRHGGLDRATCDSFGGPGAGFLPPIGKQKRYPPLTLTYIHAREREQPTDRDPVEWRLVTNLPVRSAEQAIERLSWYALRWKIEVFHKSMKSGCRDEEVKLRTPECGWPCSASLLARLLGHHEQPRCARSAARIGSRRSRSESSTGSYPDTRSNQGSPRGLACTPTKSPGSAATSTARAIRRPATSSCAEG